MSGISVLLCRYHDGDRFNWMISWNVFVMYVGNVHLELGMFGVAIVKIYLIFENKTNSPRALNSKYEFRNFVKIFLANRSNLNILRS